MDELVRKKIINTADVARILAATDSTLAKRGDNIRCAAPEQVDGINAVGHQAAVGRVNARRSGLILAYMVLSLLTPKARGATGAGEHRQSDLLSRVNRGRGFTEGGGLAAIRAHQSCPWAAQRLLELRCVH
jgi:hypothetical protein